MDTIIRGGTIVTSENTFRADIGIEGGHVVALAERLPSQNAVVIDAESLLVLPGGVDPHTHIDLPVGSTHTADDFFTAGMAAAAGGTTTLIDMAIPGDEHPLETIAIWDERARKCAVDYSYHIVLTRVDESILNEIRVLAGTGLTSLKFYMPFPGLMLTDDLILRAMAEAQKMGMVATLHCESESITAYLTQKLLDEGHAGLERYPEARPPVAEREAVSRAIDLAQAAGCVIYVVHLSTRDALARVKEARAVGLPVYAETCPQYLLLDEGLLRQERHEAAQFMSGPPLRTADHRAALWEGLRQGVLQVVSTDHCAWNHDQKNVGNTFADVPVGLPGVETRLPLLYTEAVGRRGFSVNQFVAMVSTNPAKIFGLFPQKGTIAVGSDADLALWDLEKEVTLGTEWLQPTGDFCPYEGHRLRGYPTLTMLRGKVVFDEGQYVGAAGDGRKITRKPHPAGRLV